MYPRVPRIVSKYTYISIFPIYTNNNNNNKNQTAFNIPNAL